MRPRRRQDNRQSGHDGRVSVVALSQHWGREASSPAPDGHGLRPDVEGLRAVAVVAVVLHHAHVGGFSGGYVGVDVFFVLSGFLITGLLGREIERSGRIALAAFYARRARRLLPAAVLVLVVTVLASAVLLPPLQARQVALDGVAAAVYVANYRFAAASTDYLSPETDPSPLQHYWSLAVEEQFYLAWPLLLLIALSARRRPGRACRSRSLPHWSAWASRRSPAPSC